MYHHNFERVKFITVFVAFFLMLQVVPVLATEYSFVAKWGSNGSGNGQFNVPSGLAIDSNENIYVADSDNNRIQKFASNGAFLTIWGSFGTGNGQFHYPYGVAVADSISSIYVPDSNNHRIEKFDMNGSFSAEWGSYGTGNGQFYYPSNIAISNNAIYITDSYNHRVQKFDSNGTFLAKWGSSGSGNGQFNSPQGIVVDSSGNIYVVDRNNHRIQKFDSNGNFLTKLGSNGIGDGYFSSPYGITVDSNNNLYVTDSNNHRVQKFDSSGTFVTKWGSYGTGDGQFNLPRGIVVDSSGNVYVTDTYNHRIQKFAPTFDLTLATIGTGTGTISSFGTPAGTSCGTNCLTYLGTTPITLTATPNIDSIFVSWSTGCSSSMTLSADTTCTATFNLKSNQTISFAPTPSGIYGTTAVLTATATSNLTVIFDSTTPTICTVDNTLVSYIGIGTCTLTADQAGDANYNAAPQVNSNVTVSKANITATANNKSRVYGSANPTFDFTYNGLVNGDTATTIDIPPIAVTTAIDTSPVGTYEITCSGGSDDHYEITTCDPGILTITAVSPPPPPPPTSTGSTPGATPLPSEMQLIVTLAGTGQGQVKSEPLGIDCNQQSDHCSYSFETATWIKLIPTAEYDSEFRGWGGSTGCQNGNPFMISNISCTAYFNVIVPQSPLGLVANAISETQINLNWVDRNTTGTSYIIEQSNDHVTWSVIAQTGINSTTYSDNSLTCGTTYYYHLHAVNATGQSSPSVDASGTTTACPLPPAPEPVATPVLPEQPHPVITEQVTTTEPVELHVFLSGEGSGQITSEPANIQCNNGDCEYYFAPNTEIKLIATPTEGSTLWGWGGDDDCVDGIVTLENPIHCTAYFLLEKVEPTTPTVETTDVVTETEELPATPTEPLPVAIEPQPNRFPSDSPATAKQPCPTDRHLNIHLDEDCDAEGQAIEKLKIVRGGSLADAVITGEIISEEGLISNLTLESTAILKGGYVTNVTTSKGIMKNFMFVGKQITGGQLAGKIIIASKVLNEIRDVILAPGTVIQGKIGEEFVKGKLAGKIKGDATDPALLENVTIADNATLENVILGESVVLGQNVKQKNVVMVCTNQRANGKGFDQSDFPFDDNQTCFAVQENAIVLTLDPASSWLKQPAKQLFVVIQEQKAFMFTDQWQEWDGELTTLDSAHSLTVGIVQTFEFPELNNFEGEFKFYVGLRLKNDDTIVYHQVW